MRKKYFLSGVIFVLIVTILVFIITRISFIDNKVQKLDIYYISSTTNQLVSEEISITETNTSEELILEVLQKLTTEPDSQALLSAVPKTLEILGYELDKDTLKINFSDTYNDLKESEELFCRASLVWTFTGLDFIENIEILISGEPLKKSDNEEMGLLNRDNVLINPVIDPYKTYIENVNLYFSDEMGLYLVAENRKIEVKQSENIESQIIEQLIAGPETENLFSTVPSETKIRNIKTEEGICYVDLSNDFVIKHSGGSTAEILTIYSIVNSLTDLENVTSVQFLIEGEKVTTFKGHLDISKPFERNEELISE